MAGISPGNLAGINTGTAFAGAGTGTTAAAAAIDTSAISGLVPIGAVLPWFVMSGALPDSDWLLCDGGAIDLQIYPTLVALVGTTTPDLRGFFLRGVDTSGQGRDPDGVRSVGDPAQTDDFLSHNHQGGVTGTVANGSFGLILRSTGPNTVTVTDSSAGEPDIVTGPIHITPEGGAETRPKNKVCFFIIRAK